MALKVAIIGAGVSGLAATKICLEEGLVPTCFEQGDNIGGLWNYREEVEHGRGCVMQSTVSNSSKEVMTFSDFPPPKEFPNYMPTSKVIDYLRLYAKEFSLYDYIRFQTKVVRLEKSKQFSKNGQWLLTTKCTDGHETKETFDAVMLCHGYQGHPYIPTLNGINDFKGPLIHSHEYRCRTGFEDKTILVVGIGNSGVDIAVDLSPVAKQVLASEEKNTTLY